MLNQSVYSVWEQKMFIEEELGLLDDLLKTSEAATDLFPNQATASYFNGLANERKGQFSAAVASLEQAILMSVKKPSLRLDAYVELGITYSKAKTYDKSDTAFGEALKLNSKSATALARYAVVLAARGNAAEKAKSLADEALKISGENDPSVLAFYGDYLFKSGDRDRAVGFWQRAKERGAKSATLDKKIAEKSFFE